MNTHYIDLTGKRYGRLLVLEPAKSRRLPDSKPRRYWRCLCDCGKTIEVRSDGLTSGGTRSCGCLQKDVMSAYMKAHPPQPKYGESRERLHNIWYLMNYRCDDPNCPAYKNYGGRGIRVCDEWKGIESGYFKFKEWALANGYDENLTIDRINNDGNYEPSNCRWVEAAEQNRNKRSNVKYTWNGREWSLKELAQVYKIPYGTLHSRIKALSWSLDRALNTPVRKINGKAH